MRPIYSLISRHPTPFSGEGRPTPKYGQNRTKTNGNTTFPTERIIASFSLGAHLHNGILTEAKASDIMQNDEKGPGFYGNDIAFIRRYLNRQLIIDGREGG